MAQSRINVMLFSVNIWYCEEYSNHYQCNIFWLLRMPNCIWDVGHPMNFHTYWESQLHRTFRTARGQWFTATQQGANMFDKNSIPYNFQEISKAKEEKSTGYYRYSWKYIKEKSPTCELDYTFYSKKVVFTSYFFQAKSSLSIALCTVNKRT